MPPRKVTLTNANLLEISQAISVIDAGYEVTVDGKNVRRGFHLTAPVRSALVRAGIVIKPLLEAWDKANKQAFEEFGTGTIVDKEGNDQRAVPIEKQAEYERHVRDLLDEKVEVELWEIKYEDLKVGSDKGENAIPSTAVARLAPILILPDAKDEAEA